MSKQPICEVIWRDAYGTADWHLPGEDDEPIISQTAGYLLDEDKHYYHLVTTFVASTGKLANTISIPKGCVISIKYFRGKSERKSKT